MRVFVIVLALSIVTAVRALAGGDSFEAEIVSLIPKAQDEYRLELIQHTAPYTGDSQGLPRRIIIHLRFNPQTFTPDPPAYASREKYLEAIASLKTQATKGGRFRFGIMAAGYEPIKGRRNEFQSNALSVLKQADGQMIVFSFANRV